MNFVIKNAEKNNPKDILMKIDKFCIKYSMMHIGP